MGMWTGNGVATCPWLEFLESVEGERRKENGQDGRHDMYRIIVFN